MGSGKACGTSLAVATAQRALFLNNYVEIRCGIAARNDAKGVK